MSQTIVLAAGGTGGHIFPAQALAEELTARGLKPVLVTDKRGAVWRQSSFWPEVRTVRAATLGAGIVKRTVSLFNIGLGTLQALRVLRKLKPRVVVGFGGYASFPTMIASFILGIPTVIHEQNAVLGRANRAIVGRVTRIATSFEETFGMESEKAKVVVTGNPVRASVRALENIPYPSLTPDGVLKLLVVGGSQGAAIFSSVVPAALEKLPANLRARIRIDQQCREQELESARASYQAMGISADLAPFFEDVPARLASAHLVIARAGASTLAELATAKRPAILVPLPSAMDDHQTINARAAETRGGAWLMPQDAFTPAALSARIEAFLTLPATLQQAAGSIPPYGMAAAKLADLVQELAGGHARSLKSGAAGGALAKTSAVLERAA